MASKFPLALSISGAVHLGLHWGHSILGACVTKFLVLAAAVILAIGALGLWGHPFDISLKEGAACALAAACLLTLDRL